MWKSAFCCARCCVFPAYHFPLWKISPNYAPEHLFDFPAVHAGSVWISGPKPVGLPGLSTPCFFALVHFPGFFRNYTKFYVSHRFLRFRRNVEKTVGFGFAAGYEQVSHTLLVTCVEKCGMDLSTPETCREFLHILSFSTLSPHPVNRLSTWRFWISTTC